MTCTEYAPDFHFSAGMCEIRAELQLQIRSHNLRRCAGKKV